MGFRTSFGESLQIPLGSICQDVLDDMHIFWNAGTGSIKKVQIKYQYVSVRLSVYISLQQVLMI